MEICWWMEEKKGRKEGKKERRGVFRGIQPKPKAEGKRGLRHVQSDTRLGWNGFFERGERAGGSGKGNRGERMGTS